MVESQGDHLLDLPGVGIATVSKWIALLDQDRNAIYDSRVSVALRNVCINGGRCFPIVPRRPSGNHSPWPSDHVATKTMWTFYVDYLAVMRCVGLEAGLKPSQVEMALFMIGDESCPDPDAWKTGCRPLRRVP